MLFVIRIFIYSVGNLYCCMQERPVHVLATMSTSHVYETEEARGRSRMQRAQTRPDLTPSIFSL